MALKGAPSGSAGGAALDVGYAPTQQSTGAITIEVRTLAGCTDIADAWSQLAAHALEPNPFFEPGFALAAVQHLVAFRDVVAILAWQGGARDGQRRLVGLIPCFPRQGLFVPDALIGFSDRRIFNGAPLLDRQQAQAVIAAVLDPSRQRLIEGRGLVLRHVDLAGLLVSSLRQETQRDGLTVSVRPVLSAMGAVAPADSVETLREALALKGELTLVESRTQSGLRDAVEIILAMEASGPRAQAGAATLQDTREVGFLRAMTRGLSRVRQCRVALLMLDGQPIAGAIVLGRGPRGWLYLGAQEQAHAALAPKRILLAMMRRAAPSRTILLPGGLAASGTDAVSLGDLHLSHGTARKPRDLAGRARAALRRSLFRLPRAGAAG
ncbi:GNAT family N-acetyltransferase [Bosea vaviloviae]|nr:GNAT family N-acetyltransferase [Bosea vaviloviae]